MRTAPSEPAPAAPANLYEREDLIRVLGQALRPGGLALTRRALAACPLPAGAWVLDVGCGRGATVNHLRGEAGLRALGVDLSPALLAAGRVAAARAEALPFGAARFQAVFCECVLSLLARPGVALVEFKRVLALGGLLILSDLYRPHGPLPEALAELPLRSCLQGALARSTLEAMVREVGFALELFEDHSGLLKELAARLILAGGGLAAFWEDVLGSAAPSGAAQALLDCRPGYYLLVARKGGKP